MASRRRLALCAALRAGRRGVNECSGMSAAQTLQCNTVISCFYLTRTHALIFRLTEVQPRSGGSM
jgi:hypothetical protein